MSGASGIIDEAVHHLAKNATLVLAGFYAAPIQFDFPAAFMREIDLRISAEWQPEDMQTAMDLVSGGDLSLSGIITHDQPFNSAETAYEQSVFRSPLLENGPRLERRMNAPESAKLYDPGLESTRERADLLASSGDDAPKTQIIAIYGKGGIGKSFTLANLSYMMAQQGKKVLLIGCDPKSDTTSLLFGGKACPTIIETASAKKAAGDEVSVGDVCFKRDGVFAMELGGPEVGRGCGGRGIIHGFETLEKLGFHDWDFDYVLLDFLGDVVCGGFGLPIARDMCQKVIVVASNDLQSLYVANNVCSAVEYFRKLGGNVGVAGMVTNKDDGAGQAQAFCKAVGIPELASIPAHDDIRRKSASYEIIGRPDGEWGSLFSDLATNVAEAPPHRPEPLTQDGLLELFDGDTVGRDVVLQPASLEDLCNVEHLNKPSLEVIYDSV